MSFYLNAGGIAREVPRLLLANKADLVEVMMNRLFQFRIHFIVINLKGEEMHFQRLLAGLALSTDYQGPIFSYESEL